MHGLERGTNDAEQRFVSDMKQTTDVKPPKEIGETKSRFSDAPKEIGEDNAYPHVIPNEIRDNQQKSFLDADGNKCYTDDNGDVSIMIFLKIILMSSMDINMKLMIWDVRYQLRGSYA